MASYTTHYPGNTALQQEVWTVSIAEAKRAIIGLGSPAKGTYWDANLVRPLRRAIRAHAETVLVRTAGFASGEFSNALACEG